MQRLVAIELKIGDFKPADSGQMELYLRFARIASIDKLALSANAHRNKKSFAPSASATSS